MRESFDAIVIGTGQSGPALAVRLARAGQRVAVVERGRFGGTCVNTGCIPTKTLVASAYAAHLARRAGEYGVEVGGPVRVDMRRVKARKDRVAEAASAGVAAWLRGTPNVTVVEGHARFVSATDVRVAERTLAAARIFVNVGGRPLVPPLPGLADIPYLTSSTMMDVDFLPEHLVIIGGSYIGLEFGQMYRRFGSRVTIVEKAPRLVPREDADVADGVRGILAAEGIAVETGAECMRLRREGRDVVVGLDCAGGSREVTGSHLLVAVGRVPNTDDLGVAAAGLRTDARGYLEVDNALRTNVPGIFAIGDCNGRGAFTHTSYNDYEIVAGNLLEGAARGVRDRITAYALFTDPPLARIGMTDDEVRRAGLSALTGLRPMTRVGRAVEKGETSGFIKITVDAATDKILGATILGTGGDEAIHSLLDAMYMGATAGDIRRMVHIHPTVAELLPTVLSELAPLAAASG